MRARRHDVCLEVSVVPLKQLMTKVDLNLIKISFPCIVFTHFLCEIAY